MSPKSFLVREWLGCLGMPCLVSLHPPSNSAFDFGGWRIPGDISWS